MKLNQKIKYAVACLFELSKGIGEYMDAEFIASQQRIPPAYAHKVLQILAHAGLVYSMKGRGYQLARSLENITALEVIESLSAEGTNMVDSDIGIRLESHVNQALGHLTLGEIVHAQ
ncbi:MAG: Rrf2 family transcriptional regulator [Elusimicrobia bacterium]|nr:Rrf2 family transcriptional regulator [Candidatus Obscuribacterium magneticum]